MGGEGRNFCCAEKKGDSGRGRMQRMRMGRGRGALQRDSGPMVASRKGTREPRTLPRPPARPSGDK